jgi:uncharacterized protein (TIRG00374 family)
MTSEAPESATPNAPEPQPVCAGTLARVWKWVRPVLVLGMIAGLIAKAGPLRLCSAVGGADYLWVLACLPFVVCAVMLDALKLYWLVRPVGFSGGWWSVAKTTLVVNFVSLFLPGTVGGGAVSWYRLARPDRLHAQMFVALSLNAALKIVAVCGVGALALAWDVQAAQEHRAWIAPLLVVAALPTLILLLMLVTGLTSRVKRFHVRSLPGLMPHRLHDALRKILESLEAYRSHGPSLVGALAANVARLFVGNFCPRFCLLAVGVNGVSYVRILWIMCAVEVVSMIPISLSGLGLPQVAFVGLLAAFKIRADQSLACNVVSWIPWLPIYLCAAVLMLRESFTRPDRETLM